ncbi:MAG: DUF2132 domain-containing protein [Flavobacteriales bacterium]|nr:DUF2132 domain-containing protein [Flavobacteriales bacterium]
MDIKNNDKDDTTDKGEQSAELSDAVLKANKAEEVPAKKIKKQATAEQLSNPFHGVKLVQILEELVAYYSWEFLADRVNIRCFIYNPTMKSSLGFLRKTQWAREHVEDIYLEMLDEKKAKEKV